MFLDVLRLAQRLAHDPGPRLGEPDRVTNVVLVPAAMSSRYFGERGGAVSTEHFIARLERNGVPELMVGLDPQSWRTEILG